MATAEGHWSPFWNGAGRLLAANGAGKQRRPRRGRGLTAAEGMGWLVGGGDGGGSRLSRWQAAAGGGAGRRLSTLGSRDAAEENERLRVCLLEVGLVVPVSRRLSPSVSRLTGTASPATANLPQPLF
ncbi:unnamed protein product [Linum trigynum]|uniref:Uncharacterized protein n=1 Tax=Linum trigynum TaxID=586398 RepID=A0AAV2FWH2_9ROSI